MARAFPRSDASQQPPVGTRSGRGVPWRPRPRLKKQVEEHTHTKVASWNVGTMTGKGRELAEIFKNRHIDIVCVQETKWTGKSARELGEGYKIFYSGEKSTVNGVGIILSPELKTKVIEVERTDDRMIKLKLITAGEVINIISAYAPQAGRNNEEKEQFYEKLEQLVLTCNPEELLIIGGDMNGHVGEGADGYSETHGGKGFGTRNEEGERLLDSCESLDLCIANTYYTKKEEHLITYSSGRQRSQIDYFLLRKRHQARITDCRVIPGQAAVSQHRMLCLRLMKKENVKQKRPKSIRKIRTWKLAHDNIKQAYRAKVQERYRKEHQTADEKWENMKKAVLESARETCGETKPGKRKDKKETWWWNEEVQSMIKIKKQRFKEWQKNGNDENKEAYKQAKREAKIAVAKAKTDAWKEWYENLESKEGERTIYRIARQRARNRKDIGEMTAIRNQEGDIIIKELEVKRRWREYFNTLLNVENDREPPTDIPPTEGPVKIIGLHETKLALKKMKTGKAPGCSGLTIDLLKALNGHGDQMVHDMLEAIWQNEKVPKDWQKSEIVPIYKQKGDPLECANYRGIKLLEHVMKVLERVLDLRLRELVNIDKMQFGFCKGRGTTDATFIVKQIQEKYLEKRKDLYFVFVDLEKAYDRIPRELVYWSLRKRNVPEKLVRLVKATYDNAETVVRTTHGQTEPFKIKVGLHQGSALSPFLFLVVLDTISKEFRTGLPRELLFADDLVLIAESEEEAQEMWLKWQSGMARHGLKANTSKTVVMVSSKNKVSTTIVDNKNTKLHQVGKFKYLGTSMSESGGSEEAVKARVSAAWAKWRELNGVIYDKKMPRNLKMKIYKSIIRPVLLYGAEVWALRKKEERLLETTEMKMLRRIKGVTLRDKERSKDIRRELRIDSITWKIRQIRMRWFGHVTRMEDDNQVKKVMCMEISGKRSRGRPERRWSDNIQSDLKEFGLKEKDARNRVKWRRSIQTPDPTRQLE